MSFIESCADWFSKDISGYGNSNYDAFENIWNSPIVFVFYLISFIGLGITYFLLGSDSAWFSVFRFSSYTALTVIVFCHSFDLLLLLTKSRYISIFLYWILLVGIVSISFYLADIATNNINASGSTSEAVASLSLWDKISNFPSFCIDTVGDAFSSVGRFFVDCKNGIVNFWNSSVSFARQALKYGFYLFCIWFACWMSVPVVRAIK